jgi:DinB superfamily
MNTMTLLSLAAFPEQLEAHYAAIPQAFKQWKPPSWEGIPSERYTAIEQICHVLDIELEGYQVRLRRTAEEQHPFLPTIDGDALAIERAYGQAAAWKVLERFRAARSETVLYLSRLSNEDLGRTAEFEGYGRVTLRSLTHYLCSHDQQHLAGLQWLMGQIEALPERTRAM